MGGEAARDARSLLDGLVVALHGLLLVSTRSSKRGAVIGGHRPEVRVRFQQIEQLDGCGGGVVSEQWAYPSLAGDRIQRGSGFQDQSKEIS